MASSDSKLRTSLDVFHRLRHDATLPFNAAEVLIGYSANRKGGIKQMHFSEWRLIENGGDIPMHHIVYFKLRNIKLWDRRIRLDRLYGSGNTKKSQLISNVISKLRAKPAVNGITNALSTSLKPVRDDTIRCTDKFVFFYQGWLSQHFMAPMTILGEAYNCCEQYMMAQKASIFHDDEMRTKIMKCSDPRKQKKFGRRVKHFREEEWDKHKAQVIYDANLAKFTQNKELQQKLLSFGDRLFVEASRSDKVYGIGLALKDRRADTKSNWKGLNLLGSAISNVRDCIIGKTPSLRNGTEIHRGDRTAQREEMEMKNVEKTENKENKENTEIAEDRKALVCDLDDKLYGDQSELSLTKHLDLAIECLESKLLLGSDSRSTADSKEEVRSGGAVVGVLSAKKRRKRRLKYLMKNQEDWLWTVFRTKYKYKVPAMDDLRRRFRVDLNYLNMQCVEVLDGDRVKYEDIHFIFDSIFSKRRPDVNPSDFQRSKAEWSSMFAPYPMAEDGYAVSFEYDHDTKWLPMLREYGFVVISKVLTASECDESVAAMMEEMNLRNRKELVINLQDPTTWQTRYWPSKRKFLTECPAFHPVAFRNRFHRKIESVFASIFGTNQLNVSVDNWGLNRPYLTRGDDGQRIEHPEWQHALKPHWDYSPWLWVQEMERLGFDPGYQGIVALNDHNERTGCHRNLPRGVHHNREWVKQHRYPYGGKMKYAHYDDGNMTYIRKSEKPTEDDPICQFMQNVPIRKGDLVVWSWGSLHANSPNVGEDWRFVQYIRMFPAANVHPNYAKHDRYAPQRVLNNKRNREWLFDGKLYRNEKEFVEKLKLSKREKCMLGMETY